MRNRLIVAVVIVLLLLSASWVTAQVEFDIVISGATTPTGSFRGLSDDQKVIVDFLYLTQKHQFCTSNLSPRANTEIAVCVFEDPTVKDLHHLYVDTGWYTDFVVYYNEQVVAVLSDNEGLSNLLGGEYVVETFYNYGRANDLLSTVSFSIPTATSEE